jgi:hypothetical protein
MISGPRGELARFPDRKFHLSPPFTLEDSDPTAKASTTDGECISYPGCSPQVPTKANCFGEAENSPRVKTPVQRETRRSGEIFPKDSAGDGAQ